jgi:hypothetical protein
MPFRPELNYFYLYVKEYLNSRHGVRVERGDQRILTKELMDKIREQILESDAIIADITGGNPNVFYEIGLAHAYGKPVIFLTQDDPKDAPVDVRRFEFIRYELGRHEEFLSKLDNAIHNIFIERYRELYESAKHFLNEFNSITGSSYQPISEEDFQANVMRAELAQELPDEIDQEELAEFLLPKILKAHDIHTMKKITDWVSSKAVSVS